jgi:hypothetical protein
MPWEHPLKTNAIPRQIPPQPWYLHGYLGPLLTGLIPFAVLFIELLFVFKNLWQDKTGYYYFFGFLSVVSTVLIVTVIEVTVIATYNQLCSEVRSFQGPLGQIMGCLADFLRIITGGGRASSPVAVVQFGSLPTASGITCSSSISLGSFRACCSSATVSSPALCMASWLVPLASWPLMSLSGVSIGNIAPLESYRQHANRRNEQCHQGRLNPTNSIIFRSLSL